MKKKEVRLKESDTRSTGKIKRGVELKREQWEEAGGGGTTRLL